jgi:hypothetical protein
MNSEAFVYRLNNITNGRYYIGYHKGTESDGYICSSKNYEFWQDLQECIFTRDVLHYGTKDECKLHESVLLSECFLDSKCYNFSDGNGGFLLRNTWVGVQVPSKLLIEAETIPIEYKTTEFIWYRKKTYIKLGYHGIKRDVKDAQSFIGRIKLNTRQIIRKILCL